MMSPASEGLQTLAMHEVDYWDLVETIREAS
jgi:hypothetical protein